MHYSELLGGLYDDTSHNYTVENVGGGIDQELQLRWPILGYFNLQFFSSGPAVCCSWKGKLLHFVYESLASRLNSHSSTNSCIVHSHLVIRILFLYWTVSLYSTVAILGESDCGRNRTAERIGRAQGNYKKWVRINYRLCERNLGARPQKFHAPEACSGGFWGSFSVHTYLQVAIFDWGFRSKKSTGP